MLCLDPNDRAEASVLLKDDYFITPVEEITKGSVSGYNPESDDPNSATNYEIASVMNNMANFTIGHNFRRSVLSFVV